MFSRVRSIEINGLYGRHDIKLEFDPHVNIIYGKNGTGKTTVLHVLANFLKGDFARFAHLEFDRIHVVGTKAESVVIERVLEDDEDGRHVLLSVGAEHIRLLVPVSLLKRTSAAASDDSQVTIDPYASARRLLELPGVTYFPAYRTMIEAWATARIGDELRSSVARSQASREREAALLRSTPRYEARLRSLLTTLARDTFGDFAPDVDFLSPQEIEAMLASRVHDTALSVLAKDREISSKAFIQAFAALSADRAFSGESSESLLEDIRLTLEELDKSRVGEQSATASDDVYSGLRLIATNLSAENLSDAAASILKVYRDSLHERVDFQTNSLASINAYVGAVNEFLEGKQLVVDLAQPRWSTSTVRLLFDDDARERLRILSSGERQIVTMLFAAFEQSLGNVVLIDEPELSLHIDWQRKLMPKMVRQLGETQIIVCTHSPEIGADFDFGVQELTLSKSDRRWRKIVEEINLQPEDSDELESLEK
ncbi:AAA family ATPase [soil metagenome]